MYNIWKGRATFTHHLKNALPLSVVGTLLFLTPKADPRCEAAQVAKVQVDRTPVVVELFTSEGCSTCPPADALLSQLETDQPIEGAQIIGLEEHVDYWNQDGWVDSYSSPAWTLRQQEYVARFKDKSPFTPQMIVDGQRQLVGNSVRDAQDAIQEAAHRAKAQISITTETPSKSDAVRFEVRVESVAGIADQGSADIWMAITEDGLETAVKAGENAGRNLRHAAILRSLHKIGTIPARGAFPLILNQQVKLKSNWKRTNLRIVTFVQQRKNLHILGAASARVTG
jgi:hypothetical protein